jgi:sulfur relay (sulfurtransferase) complex TusBCD TusD component (DsrE family)
VKVLVIVNDSPWGSSLARSALRLSRAMLDGGQSLVAVYFRGEGIYNALPAEAADGGAVAMNQAWRALAAGTGIPLLLCASAVQRRFDSGAPEGFREAGLAEVLERMSGADRVVSF